MYTHVYVYIYIAWAGYPAALGKAPEDFIFSEAAVGFRLMAAPLAVTVGIRRDCIKLLLQEKR